MKAAGLMHGIASVRKYPWSYFIENVKARFERLYELNVKSVCKQYKREFDGLDMCEYQDVFDEYSQKAQVAWIDNLSEGLTRAKIREQLICFFQCVDYQIEDEEMSREACAYMFTCIESFLVVVSEECTTWGEIDI